MRRNEEKDNKEIPPKLDVGANKNCEKMSCCCWIYLWGTGWPLCFEACVGCWLNQLAAEKLAVLLSNLISLAKIGQRTNAPKRSSDLLRTSCSLTLGRKSCEHRATLQNQKQTLLRNVVRRGCCELLRLLLPGSWPTLVRSEEHRLAAGLWW